MFWLSVAARLAAIAALPWVSFFSGSIIIAAALAELVYFIILDNELRRTTERYRVLERFGVIKPTYDYELISALNCLLMTWSFLFGGVFFGIVLSLLLLAQGVLAGVLINVAADKA